MERPLVEELELLERGYRAARWKLELGRREQITTRGDYRRWLAGLQAHERVNAERLHALAGEFLQGLAADQSDTLYELRVNALLRSDPAVLYGISVVLGETPMPAHPTLVDHVNWVAGFVTRQG